MRVRMEQEGRLTLKMQWKETDGSTLGIGKPSWRRPRDWPMITLGWTPTLRSWGWMACKDLDYLCMMRPPAPCLTPQEVQPHACRGCQWSACCCWRQQSSAGMQSWCTSMRRSWTISEPRPMGRPCIAVEDTCINTLLNLFVIKLMVVVIVKINKAVVGSGCGDTPKYVGEGVALCGAPGALGALLPCYSCVFMAVLGNFRWACFRRGASKVMSYVISWHCTYIGHVTFYYKRLPMPQWGVLACCSSIHQVQLYHQRPSCGWCLMCVGCNASSMSLGGSLLPSTVIIVSALVNSTVSPTGPHKYLNETRECHSTPC